MFKKFLLIVAVGFVILGFGITIYFLYSCNSNIENSTKLAGTISGFVGPLISAAGFFFLFLNFREQRDTLHENRLEGKFYEMVKFHRDNINEMTYTYYERDVSNDNTLKRETAEKRKVFKIIHKQFEDLYYETVFLFQGKKETEIYESSYLLNLRQNTTIHERNIDVLDYAKIDILYLIIFFGLSKTGLNTIVQLTQKKYNQQFIEQLLTYCTFKPKRESDFWKDWCELNEKHGEDKLIKLRQVMADKKKLVPDVCKKRSFIIAITYCPEMYNKYYGGHQFRLGHYFRNMYQAVKCIHDDRNLKHIDKYGYIKVLRGQLSTYEQIIFFLNSLSQLGRAWELQKKSDINISLAKKDQLITAYNLIKNIPEEEVIDSIKYSSFYPLVSYETNYDKEIKEKRRQLKKQFR